MAYPDLYKDESKILEARNIKVKSVSFEAVLTNRRLVLLDSKKGMPAQEILLATLKNIDGGENAIRDPTITLSIITNTGTTRQMILTFPKASGGERKRECDEWVKALRQNLSHPFEHPVLPDIPAPEYEEYVPAQENVPVTSPPPRIEIVSAPPQKKRIEISRPMKKIIESEPAMPQPVETSSLPVGSFCNRCGSRVPPESAFCNRCGTPVVKDSDLDFAFEPAVAPQPAPPQVTYQQAVSAVDYTPEEPATVVPQVAVPLPPVFGQSADRKERPIEQVIHSIEPLIEDSVPRTEMAPLMPRPAYLHVPEPVAPEPEPVAAPPAVSPVASPAEGSEIKWPVISPSAMDAGSPAAVPEPPMPPAKTGSPGRGKTIAIALLAIVIIAAIAGVFIFANPLQTINAPTPTPTPTPAITTITTTMPVTTKIPVVTTTAPEVTSLPTTAPAAKIPPTGVWVHINYANQFSGQVGTPNAQREVSDTGEKFYQISTSTGTVTASVQKVDGSADPLTVEIYKDGELVMKKSSVAPKGMVEIQVSLKPAATPAPVPETTLPAPAVTAASNATANATAPQ
jgi:hypothetical protein